MTDVILVHGIADRKTIFDKLKARLGSEGHRVHAIDPRSRQGREPLELLAQRLKAFVDAQVSAEAEINLIGFSMGGIVSRYYLQRLGGLARTRKLITISSPHQGTNSARLLPFSGARQLRPNSAFLRDLNSDAEQLEQVGFVSIWTPFDLMILPAHSSALGVGQSHSFPVALHALVPKDPRVIDLVASELSG